MSPHDAPRFDDLPIRPDLPPRSAWGVFGDDDQLGTLNFLSTEGVRAAAGLVRDGRVFSLNWSLDLPSPPVLGRGAARHHHATDPGGGTDDWYDNFHPQASSQWDALCHIRHPEHGFYNGTSDADTPYHGGDRLAIDAWARRGIAGRFVLADIAGARERAGTPLDPSVETRVGVDEVERVLREQGTDLAEGDILLLHFGWTRWYEGADEAARIAMAEGGFFPTPGLARGVEAARWLWDHRVAAVAADCPAVEAMPFELNDEETFLHLRLIPLLGMVIGEMFDLDGLATFARETGRFDGLFTAAPLNMPRGSGSTANALALM